MSLSYSTIAWATSASKGQLNNVDYSSLECTTSGKTFSFLGSMGDVAFAYAGHGVVLEIQATIPSTSKNPSKKPMWSVAPNIMAVIHVIGSYQESIWN